MAKKGRGWLAAALAVLTLTVLVPLATFLVAVWLLGWQLHAVQSGSMAPTYPVGSLLVVGAIDPSRVEVGMPIVFVDPVNPERTVIHRVVEVLPADSPTFRTQGDANPGRDPFPVTARLLRGQVLWQVPQLGAVLDWLQWPRSFVLFVVLPALILVAGEVRKRFGSGRGTNDSGPIEQPAVQAG